MSKNTSMIIYITQIMLIKNIYIILIINNTVMVKKIIYIPEEYIIQIVIKYFFK